MDSFAQGVPRYEPISSNAGGGNVGDFCCGGLVMVREALVPTFDGGVEDARNGLIGWGARYNSGFLLREAGNRSGAPLINLREIEDEGVSKVVRPLQTKPIARGACDSPSCPMSRV